MTEDVQKTELEFLEGLVKHKLLIPTGVPGVFGKSATFEGIIEKFDQRITREGRGDNAEVMRFPPLLNRASFEKSEYLKSFPHLAGAVHSFSGTEAQHKELLAKVEAGADWSAGLAKTDVVLTPAACYPVYPTLSGVLLPEGGRLVDVYSFCFRHEPSSDPARMQMFRMREYIRIGEPATVQGFRETWLERGKRMMGGLGLDIDVVDANDPFFGRGGKMLAMNQRDQHLKFELTAPICSVARPTALLSFNYHQDHFGLLFDIRTAKNEVAHTACVGFGMERVALALIKKHGFAPVEWPAGVRSELAL